MRKKKIKKIREKGEKFAKIILENDCDIWYKGIGIRIRTKPKEVVK